MAVPKKRKSHSRTRMQRAHDALVRPHFITCANCREPRQLHRICGSCGQYRSRQVLAVVQK